MMLDWSLYLKQLTATIGQIATADPEIVRGYRTLSEAGRKTGKLDVKTRELIALGVAVTRQCDRTHRRCDQVRCHEEDLIEALSVAIAVNAGAALVYSARTLDAFTAHTSDT